MGVSKMKSYSLELTSIQEILRGFARTQTIDAHQLSTMDEIIKRSEQDQFRILNSSFSSDVQRIMFGAIRNINTAVKGMKTRLRTASERRENPTTAEQALELMENLSNVAHYVDLYVNKGQITDLQEIDKLSRLLYRKANSLGFSQDQMEQLKEAGITEKQIESFVSSFDNKVSQQLEIEEEVQSKIEATDTS